ncbi:MAG: V-type ATP synthase subunit F [Candidatus Micrarchaeia archaeon]
MEKSGHGHEEKGAPSLARLSDRIAIVGDSTFASGFRLAGIENCYIVEGAGIEEKVSSLLSDPSYGIVVVSDRAMEGFDWRLKKRIESAAKPVVVAIPDRRGPVEQSESLAKLIKRAIGFDLMKKK